MSHSSTIAREKFIQSGFVIVGQMMYSNGTVQLLSFRKQIMGWEMEDAQPRLFVLLRWLESTCVCMWKRDSK